MSDKPQFEHPSDTQPRRSRAFPRARLPCPPVAHASVPGFENIRLCTDSAEAGLVSAADHLSMPRSAWASGRYDILALSGGAAGGAYGAGAIAGWSETGTRPAFALVTGVSTGALIAPLAFLGPQWDHKLKEAYTGGYAQSLLSPRRVAAPFSGGLISSRSLDELIAPFIDAELIEAVATEHARGRRLLVSTTDLDRQEPSVWDMGAIASHGGEAALNLFRDVLVASASLPGIFAPRRIRVEHEGQFYEEMHVDGGVASPLFLMPTALMQWQNIGRRLRGGRVHVLINTVLDPDPITTSPNIAAVMTRSFEAMLRFSYRQALTTATTLCASRGIPLNVASIPPSTERGHAMNFETAAMERLFEAGRERARSGHLWSTAVTPSGLGRWKDHLLK